MTFTKFIKEEICRLDNNDIEKTAIVEAFLKYTANFDKYITITIENAAVARFIYKLVKEVYGISPSITVRIQKRFRIKQIYILEIKEKIDFIKSNINNNLDSDEEKIAFLKGAFLGIGNISNPKTSGYHLEYILNNENDANYISNLLNDYNLKSKVIKRGYKYITYIKASESISDLIKMFRTMSSLFEFEDTRIYRDHKNMVNRLNNCEVANQEKTIKSALSQIDDINFLKDNDLIELLDDKVRLVIDFRLKYPDVSYQELANIISLETDYKVGKSGINHHFRTIRKIKENFLNNRGV